MSHLTPFSQPAVATTPVDLPDGRTFGFEVETLPATLAVVRGHIWLTLEGDPHDYVLRAGQTFTANRVGRVVVQALCDSRVRIDRPRVPSAMPAATGDTDDHRQFRSAV